MNAKSRKILESAEKAAANAETWADLSNALFDPQHGLVARAYPTRAEREKFIKSPEYQSIKRLVNSAVERTGLVQGAVPTKSGRFVVRLPGSLHAALEAEAEREGVSLNQLVLTKLAVQLSDLVGAAKGHK